MSLKDKQSELQSFEDLISQVLYSDKGFYETERLETHFITPSIGGASYAQIIAAAAAAKGLRHIIEYGAGTAALAEHLAPYFEHYDIIEKSSYCRQIQQQALKAFGHISWQESLSLVDAPTLVLLQEVFDCLEQPVCCYDGQNFFEALCHGSEIVQHAICQPQRYEALQHYSLFLEKYANPSYWQQKQLFILPYRARLLLQDLYNNLPEGSMVLIIDYGEPQPMLASKWERYQIPLRAYYKHHVIDWRHCLYQSADITYDVDFFYLMFCWLECGGHVQNYTSLGQWLAQKITKEQGRTLRLLLEPRMMGQRFKFLELIK